MWTLDAYQLARLQFAFTVGFHIIFPAFSIGLAAYLMVLEGLWLRTSRQVYMDVYQYWLKIFAVVFGIGVVTGLVMSYEFGTNWSDFARRTGPILGPLLGYETLTAFFMEAGFLGIMLFGLRRVGQRLHFAATCLVALGTHMSAGWIMASNSWMQTPDGYAIVDGVFEPVSWLRIIFNPSYPYRFVHMLGAAYLSVAFVVGAVGAFHLLRNSGNQAARVMFSMAMWMAVCATPLQIIAGDILGENTLRYQPQKVSAMEGDWDKPQPGTGEPLVLFGLPDQQEHRNGAEIAIPHIGSLYLTHTWSGTIQSLSEFPPSELPYVPIVFYAFRIMVGLGMLMFAVGMISLLLRRQDRLFAARWFQRATVAAGPAGFGALLAGWVVTEAGRQPFTVYGLLRTAQSVSPIGTPGVMLSLDAFAVVYFIVLGAAGLFLLRLFARPPAQGEPGPPRLPQRAAGITPGPIGVVELSANAAEGVR
jgi:cytochrome bd ubiquinol oxidase subunit I